MKKEGEIVGAGSSAKNEIVVYQPNETLRIDVRLENESVWLSQAQMAQLFGCSVDNVGLHLRNIYKSGELSRSATAEDFSVVQKEGARMVTRRLTCYNLDAIISVGYRVNSVLGVRFRQWATSVLREYLLRGYAVNARLTQLEDRLDRRLSNHEQKIANLEKRVDFFVRTELPPHEGVLFEGQIKDGYDLALKIIRSARTSIVLIDNYVDERVLTMLEARGPKVAATIYTKRCTRKLQLDVANHNRQYRPIVLKPYAGAHDRFLIADSTVYHLGASLKDLGTALFAFSKMSISADLILSQLTPRNRT